MPASQGVKVFEFSGDSPRRNRLGGAIHIPTRPTQTSTALTMLSKTPKTRCAKREDYRGRGQPKTVAKSTRSTNSTLIGQLANCFMTTF